MLSFVHNVLLIVRTRKSATRVFNYCRSLPLLHTLSDLLSVVWSGHTHTHIHMRTHTSIVCASPGKYRISHAAPVKHHGIVRVDARAAATVRCSLMNACSGWNWKMICATLLCKERTAQPNGEESESILYMYSMPGQPMGERLLPLRISAYNPHGNLCTRCFSYIDPAQKGLSKNTNYLNTPV